MTQTQQQCSTADQLLIFLRGQLSPQKESELQLHLNDCVICRERLENTAADANAWNEARKFFGTRALQESSADCIGGHEEAAQGSQRIRQVLDALAPTDDPQSLGRIGGYEVTGVVGSGGMGVVLKAHDRSLDRVVAVKVMSPHLANSGSARKRFAREAKAAAAVLHPNVIAIHSVDSESANPYLVMPYVRGSSLQKRIDAQGPLSLKETLRIGTQIAAGLAAAHEQGLVHRDIKPANILLEEGVERVTITDFGLARAVDDASMTCSGVIAGTPQYMSPEQTRGESIDARSDLFSLGSVLYAMCAGRPPFRAETTYGVLHRIANEDPTSVCEVNSDVPVWLGQIIERLMAKRPEDRFESAAQVAVLLEGCLAHVQQPATIPLPVGVQALAARALQQSSTTSNPNHIKVTRQRIPSIGKSIAATASAVTLLFLGIMIVLQIGKGTPTRPASRKIQNTVDALVTIRSSGSIDGASVAGSGMGWRVDDAGHFLVPSHIVPEGEETAIELRYSNGAICSATRLKTLGHFTLLRSNQIVEGPVLSLDSVVSLSTGEAVTAILNGTDNIPGSIKNTGTTIAFSELEGVTINPSLRFQNVISTDFVANETTLSGAPLLTKNGDVAGMLIRLGSTQLIAIPVAEIRVSLQQLREYTVYDTGNAYASTPAETVVPPNLEPSVIYADVTRLADEIAKEQ